MTLSRTEKFQDAYRKAWLAETVSPRNKRELRERNTAKFNTSKFQWRASGSNNAVLPLLDDQGNLNLRQQEQSILHLLSFHKGLKARKIAQIALNSDNSKSISPYIQRLKNIGLVEADQEGRLMVYRLTKMGRTEHRRRKSA